jgi:PKHD-type hydroxylase
LLVHCPDLFTPQGVEAIKRDLSRIPPHAAELSSGLRTDYRRVTTRDFGVGYNWIIDPIVDVVVAANDQAFGFHIDGVAEGLNYLVYESTGDQYRRHIDLHMADINSDRANRKLTYVLQLSEPDEYEGCDLILDGGADDGMPIPRELGSLSIFPAFLAHEVTPLIKGERHSIVGWAHGDAWR